MLETLKEAGGWLGTTIVVIALFVRIEHRMTKVETILDIIAGKIGLCLPNSDKSTK